MREFDTAVQEAYDETEGLADDGSTFKINERAKDGTLVRSVECTYYRPTPEQVAMLMSSLGRHTSHQTQLAGAIDFFVAVLDEDSHAYIVDRLMNRNDPFGLEDVEPIIMEMVEEWTGRPTQPPSGSTQSRSNGGRKSTPRTTKSTSSGSVPVAS